MPDTVIVSSSVPEVRDTVVVSCVASDDVCDVPASAAAPGDCSLKENRENMSFLLLLN